MADVDVGETLVSLQEAADRLKVHYMTAYRWVRRGQLPAFKAGGRLRIRTSDLERFMADRKVDVALGSSETGRTDWELHRRRLHQLLVDGDGPATSALAHKVIADGASASDVYVHLMTPALHQVGADWSAGRISVAEEHRASEIVSALMGHLGELFRRRGPSRGAAITLTPPGELHALASQMVADFLRALGYDVHHLGANVPLADLRIFLQVVPADVVAVSVTTATLEPSAYRELVDAARAENPARLVVIGGQGADAEAIERAGARHIAALSELPAALGMATG